MRPPKETQADMPRFYRNLFLGILLIAGVAIVGIEFIYITAERATWHWFFIHLVISTAVLVMLLSGSYLLIRRAVLRSMESRQILTIQRDLALRISGTEDLPGALGTSFRTILDATGLGCGGIYLVDEKTGALDLACHEGLSDEFVMAVSHYEADTASARLVREGTPVYSRYQEFPVAIDDVREKEGLKAIAVVPIREGGRVLGCVNAGSRSMEKIPEKARVVMEALVDTIGEAISRSRLVIRRKEAEVALRESEERYRLIVDISFTGILVNDGTNVVYINDKFLKMTGYPREYFEGKGEAFSLLVPQDQKRVSENVQRTLFGEHVDQPYDVKYVRRNGEIAQAQLMTSLISVQGAPAVMVMIHDITERRKYEERLERVNVELDGYARTVSHDLRSPLSAIQLASDSMEELLKGPVDERCVSELQEIIGIVDRNVSKSNALIKDLLALARAGHLPDVVSEVDVSEVVRRALDECAARIEEKGMKVEVGEALGNVRASNTHVYQVFTNLIGNAIRHNDSVNPVLSIRSLGDDDSGGHRYLVRDNGPGIPPENLDKVFAPFFKGKTGDIGVGLAIVEKIVKSYDGYIKAYNDDGACFELVFHDS